jgi:CRISPR/Cas system-associated protein Csm6
MAVLYPSATKQSQIWGTVLWQYLYRLEEIDMTVKLIGRNFSPLK